MEDVNIVFFDLDETLYNYGAVRLKATLQVAEHVEELGLVEAGKFISVHQKIWKEIYRKYKGKCEMFNREIRFREVFRELKVPVKTKLIKELANLFWSKVYEEMKPYRDVKPCLEALKREGVKIGLISDGYVKIQAKKLEALKIRKYFDVETYSEEVGENKPSKKIFLLALKKAGLPAEEAVMVGDNLKTDILGAKKTGLKTILVKRGIFKDLKPENEWEEPDFIINELTETPKIIKGMKSFRKSLKLGR